MAAKSLPVTRSAITQTLMCRSMKCRILGKSTNDTPNTKTHNSSGIKNMAHWIFIVSLRDNCKGFSRTFSNFQRFQRISTWFILKSHAIWENSQTFKWQFNKWIFNLWIFFFKAQIGIILGFWINLYPNGVALVIFY